MAQYAIFKLQTNSNHKLATIIQLIEIHYKLCSVYILLDYVAIILYGRKSCSTYFVKVQIRFETGYSAFSMGK
jgi:hypothetical protein